MTYHKSIKMMLNIFMVAGLIALVLSGSVSTNRALASEILFKTDPEPVIPGPEPAPFAPVISVDPTEIVSMQSAELVTQPLTITNSGDASLDWTLTDAFLDISWSDNFDSYPPDTSMHGVGGWKGWDNSPAATAYTRNIYAHSAPNSVEIVGVSDLVHEYSGYTSGSWTYTAWQYIPTAFTGESYFIMLNTYNDGGPYNWSVQVDFDSATNTVINTGASGGTLALIKGQWVELRVEINLDADTTSFYYNDQLLYSGTWTDEVSGGGVARIAAVDLWGNNAGAVYYDDISLGSWEDIAWLSTDPETGSTPAGSSSTVDVNLDATGMALGVYTATLYAESNDPVTPLLSIPVTMTVLAESDLAIVMEDVNDPVYTSELITYTLTVTNTGPQDASEVTVVDTLPAGSTFHHASAGCAHASGVVTCTIGSLANGATADLTIVIMAPSVSGMITNTATVSGSVIDNNLGNNTASEETTVNSLIARFFLPLVSR